MNLTRLAFILLCGISLFAEDKFPSADVLNRWVGGKWVGEGHFGDSGQANKANWVTRCALSPDHIFVICDQDVNVGGKPMRDLSIYTFAPKTSKFYFYGVSLGEEKPRSTALEISDSGNRWVYSSADQNKGKDVQFRTTNQFRNDDTVEWWSESSDDGGKTWTKTGQGTETRQK